MHKAYLTGYLLNRASWSMSRKIRKLLEDRNMTEVSVGFIGVLFTLYEKDARTITELCETVALEKSTMTGLLDRMEAAGLLKRNPDRDDRRVSRIMLTTRGAKIENNLKEVVEQAYQQLTRGISQENLETARHVMEKIIENARNGRPAR